MFQNKKLKHNATSAIVEVAKVALLIALCPPLNFSSTKIITLKLLNIDYNTLNFGESEFFHHLEISSATLPLPGLPGAIVHLLQM